MEANEQGLTTEERIMFAVLGIILVIAIGVLTVNYFSTHERVEGTSTAEKERDNQEDNEKNTPSKDSLKETTNDYSKITYKGIPKVIKTKSTNSKSKKSTSPKQLSNQQEEKEDEDNNGQGSTLPEDGEIDDEGVVKYEDELDWTFNTNIVKESYANEIIKVPNTVKLTDDSEKEAEVKIVNSKTGEEITIENNEVSLPSGEYKYIYTCNGFTKELPLVVYNRLEDVEMEIIKENDLLKEIDETNHDDLYYLINHSNLTQDKNDYKIVVHRLNNYNLVILKAKLPFEFKNISTNTKGISLFNDKQTYNLAKNEFIIHMDLNQISLSKTNKVFLTIDNVEYLFNFDISITNDTVSETTKEDLEEDQKVEDPEEKENEEKVEDPKEEDKDKVEDPEVKDNEKEDPKNSNTDESKPSEKEEEKEETEEVKEENTTSEEQEQKENPSEVKDPEKEKDSENNDKEEKQKPNEDSKEEQKEVEKNPDPTPEEDETIKPSDDGLNNTETPTVEQPPVEEVDISPTT